MMERVKFTSDDWDYVMKMNPDLREKYQEMLNFNKLNPKLAEEIDREMLKILNTKL